MHDKMKYVNTTGETIELGHSGMYVNYSDVRDYSWNYVAKSNKIKRFEKEIVKKELPIVIKMRNREEMIAARDRLYEVIDKDVAKVKHGRLYVGEYYLECYLIGCKNADYLLTSSIKTTLTLITDRAKWIREIKSSYATGGQPAETETYMDFAYDYAYDYSSSSGWAVFENPGYAPADFELTIHGPCENPEVLIAGHSYLVNCELLTGEYLKINSITRKIYKVCVNGEQVNQFALRSRDSYIFEKIPAGDCVVAWDGSFGFDIVLYEERSEPRWT